MTVKKSLENRIRGWFPQEPTMIITRLKVNHEYKQPPQIIPLGYNASATKLAGGFAVFYIILFGLLFLTYSFNFVFYPISIIQIMAWILAGLVVGTITVAIFTQNQLSRLSKDYQISTNGKDMVLLIIPTVLFFILCYFVSWSIYGAMGLPINTGFLISGYSWGISIGIIRFVSFFGFEKKESMRLMQSWWGTKIFLVPKAPNNPKSQ